MAQRQKALQRSILIAVLGIIIGLLGELMPDDVKHTVAAWATDSLGFSFTTVWMTTTAVVISLLLWLTWRDVTADNEVENATDSTPTTETTKPAHHTTQVNNEGAHIKNQFNGGTFNDTTFN